MILDVKSVRYAAFVLFRYCLQFNFFVKLKRYWKLFFFFCCCCFDRQKKTEGSKIYFFPLDFLNWEIMYCPLHFSNYPHKHFLGLQNRLKVFSIAWAFRFKHRNVNVKLDFMEWVNGSTAYLVIFYNYILYYKK